MRTEESRTQEGATPAEGDSVMVNGLICDCAAFRHRFDCGHIAIIVAKLNRGERLKFPFAIRDKFQPKIIYLVEDVLHGRAS